MPESKRVQLLQQVRSIPAAIGVRDPESKRVHDAVREVLSWLALQGTILDPPRTQSLLVSLLEGENVRIERLGTNKFRISAEDSGRRIVLGTDPSAKDPEDPGTDVVTIGSDTEGDEEEDTTDFTVGTDGNGLEEWYCSRIGYFHEGDKKLYGYYRLRTYDKYGRLYSVSGETRVELDETEAET